MGIIYLAAGLLIVLLSCHRFIQHHADFRFIEYTHSLLGIMFIVTAVKRLRSLRKLQSQ